MSVIDQTLVAEAGRRLAAAAPDAQVILFGSHARGEANPHSDVDFLVVEPEVANEAEESVRLHRTLRDLRLPADVIVVSRDYAERWREVRGGIVHAALSQGRVLARGDLRARQEGSGMESVKLPAGYLLPEGTTLADVRQLELELLASEGLDIEDLEAGDGHEEDRPAQQ